jgi:trans-aconitate methyltransferase
MTVPVYEQDAAYYDADFGTNRWIEVGGPIQSLVFYNAMIVKLQDAGLINVLTGSKVIHDYGCATGDGTALLQALLPDSTVKGFDWSEVAINTAKKRWPIVEFEVKDIREASEQANVIITSHTLEHVPGPLEVARKLRSLCNMLIIAVPKIDEHYDQPTHKGALPTKEWLDKLEGIIHKVEYLTKRDYGDPELVMIESNILVVATNYAK